MAILFDAASKMASIGGLNESPVSWSHTSTGSDLILWVFVEAAFSVASPTPTISVTCDGVSMTQLAYVGDSISFAGEAAFYLYNPSVGTKTIQVTYSVDSGNFQCSGIGVSYTGAKQGGSPDSYSTLANADINPVTKSTTVVGSNCWLVAVAESGYGDPTGYNGVTTLRKRGNIYGTVVDSNGTVATGSQNLSVQYTDIAGSCMIIASFAPSIPPLLVTNQPSWALKIVGP